MFVVARQLLTPFNSSCRKPQIKASAYGEKLALCERPTRRIGALLQYDSQAFAERIRIVG